MKEVDKLTLYVNRNDKTRDHNMNKNKKKLVHIECLNPDDRNIGQLLKDLDEMCQKLGKHEVFWKPNVPIFSQVNFILRMTSQECSPSNYCFTNAEKG